MIYQRVIFTFVALGVTWVSGFTSKAVASTTTAQTASPSEAPTEAPTASPTEECVYDKDANTGDYWCGGKSSCECCSNEKTCTPPVSFADSGFRGENCDDCCDSACAKYYG